MKTAPCRRCGTPFGKYGPQLFCKPCMPLADRERVDAYHQAHPEIAREAKRKWRLNNREKNLAAGAAWRAAHPEKVKAYRLITKRRYPQLNSAYVRARKVRIRGNSLVPFTPQQLAARLEFYGGRCWMCGGVGNTLDHVIPISRGGPHILANIRPACRSCNSRKGSRLPSEMVAA